MNGKTLKIHAGLVALLLMIVSCRHDSDVPAFPVVSFTNDVQAILVGNCTQGGCHGNVDTQEFSLITYDDVMSSGTITPGDAHNSEILKSVTGRSEWMPPSPQSPLTNRQILFIYVWIEQGAINN